MDTASGDYALCTGTWEFLARWRSAAGRASPTLGAPLKPATCLRSRWRGCTTLVVSLAGALRSKSATDLIAHHGDLYTPGKEEITSLTEHYVHGCGGAAGVAGKEWTQPFSRPAARRPVQDGHTRWHQLRR